MDLYDLLNEIIVVKKYCLSESIYKEEYKDKLETEDSKKLYDLMRKVSSLATRVTTSGITFHPHMIWEGKRTYAIEDLTEEDYAALASIDIIKLPLCLRARVSDILWIQKKSYKSALDAVKAYQEMFMTLLPTNDWVEILDYIKRAICISIQIKEASLYQESCKFIYDYVIVLGGNNRGFLSLRLLDILIDQKYGETRALLGVIESTISSNNKDVAKVEQAYGLKIALLKKDRNNVEVTHASLQLADYYLDCATEINRNDAQGCFNAIEYMKHAIFLYRDNGEGEKADTVHRKMVELQREVPKLMKSFAYSINLGDTIQKIETNMAGLSFEENILRITQMIAFFKKDTIKQQLLEDIKNHPLSHLGNTTVINDFGQTILTLQPLNMSNPEKDPELLDLYINKKLVEQANINGVLVEHALDYIRHSYNFTKDSINFLVYNNPIIPGGREGIFRSAIFMILNGAYYEGMHILAPQTENLFRSIAKEAGSLTLTLENDGTSKEKVLSSIFDLPELLDCYDNDILFVFKALLNEASGANIRNNIAHGLTDEAKASSGEYLYFAGAVIKLLSFTSVRCYEIYRESKKLKEFH